MKYYVIAGEASGDLHASALMRCLSKKDPKAQFRCWGGDMMVAAGGTLVKHYRDLAFMGFWEVIRNIRTILGNLTFCKKDIIEFQPEVLILVDYPGFNLRIAKWAKSRGFRVFYYISPQVWAWNSRRVHDIKKWVEAMFVILPFEKSFYANFDYSVHYVGHPLLDVVDNFKERKGFRATIQSGSAKPVIALLPGSRLQEIKRMLPIMLKMSERFPEFNFVVAGAPSVPDEVYVEIIQDPAIILVRNDTYNLLNIAEAALVTSGTATLETALFNVPQVVCYKGNRWSYFLARRLVKVDFIALVNLIMERAVVKELIQESLTEDNLEDALSKIVQGGQERKAMLAAYSELKERLGRSGAAERTAGLMYSIMSK